jgi:hypothetical protein
MRGRIPGQPIKPSPCIVVRYSFKYSNLPHLACMFAFCRISTAADLTFGALSSVGNAQMKHSEELEGASR